MTSKLDIYTKGGLLVDRLLTNKTDFIYYILVLLYLFNYFQFSLHPLLTCSEIGLCKEWGNVKKNKCEYIF